MILYAVVAPLATAGVFAVLLGTASLLEQRVLTNPAEVDRRRRR